MRLYRKTRIPHWYEFYRTPCPICGHVGGCMIHEKGDRVACIRVESEQYFSKDSALPSYLHWLKPKQKRKIDDTQEEYIEESKKLDPSKLDIVYRTMLESLKLTDSHYNHLTSKRKLAEQQILIRKYASFPDKPWNIAKKICKTLGINNLQGVPGFYLHEKKYWTLSGKNGILIPYRNQYNQIVGLQYRLDTPPNEIHVLHSFVKGVQYRLIQPNRVIGEYKGKTIIDTEIPVGETGEYVRYNNELYGIVRVMKGNRYFWLSSANKPSGTGVGNPIPVHVSVPTSQLVNWKVGTLHRTKSIWLTEGALKADIAVDYLERYKDIFGELGTTMIALPGVGAWKMALPILEEMGVEVINLAFDSDAVNNINVYKHLIQSLKAFKDKGYKANLVIWNAEEAKGIDDLFIKEKIPQIKKLF